VPNAHYASMPTAVEVFFLDTNVFLHCVWLDELPWNGAAFVF